MILSSRQNTNISFPWMLCLERAMIFNIALFTLVREPSLDYNNIIIYLFIGRFIIRIVRYENTLLLSIGFRRNRKTTRTTAADAQNDLS